MKKPAGVTEIFLQPGDFYFGGANTRIRTLLGSCVSITAWHPKRLLGGMCHYLLPGRNIKDDAPLGRYAEEAMDLLLANAEQHKTPLKDYQIKIFGGGEMFPQQESRHKYSVARKNIEAAWLMLARHELKPISQDVGLSGHRSVIFDVWSGHVWVRYQPLMGIKKHQ